MGELINLRTARKRAKRTLKEQQAEQNRARFGQTKSASQLISDERERNNRALDGHKIQDTDANDTQ